MTSGSGNRACIDTGSSVIKILQVSGTSEKLILTAIGSKKITGLSGSDISGALKALAQESRVTAKDASISLSGPSVIVRFITLPKMDESALKSAMRYEAEKFIPYNINDCVIDFQTLRKDEKEDKLNVLLVAAKKEYVQDRIKLAEDAGFSVRVIDVDSFALANAFMKNNLAANPDKSYAVLNIGSLRTNVSILKGDLICFARDIIVGGNDFTSAISKKFGIDAPAAEELKQAESKDKEKDIADCVRGVSNDLLDEIKLSFGYYENQAGKSVDEIYLSGGAKIPGLEQMFEETLGSMPVSWDPLSFMDTSSAGVNSEAFAKTKNSFAIAAGLALR